MRTNEGGGESGVALILVVLTFAVLAVMAGEFARAMREEALSVANFKREGIAHYVAVAGVNEVLMLLHERRGKQRANSQDGGGEEEREFDPLDVLVQADGQWLEARFDGSPYEVRVIDEGGRLSLNDTDRDVIEDILFNLGYSELEAETVADSVEDWRDEDDLHRPNGAEDQYYESLPRPYRCKNGDFDSVAELLLVRGVSSDIYYGNSTVPGLRDLFSVFNGSKRLNLQTVGPAVMVALTGIDQEDALDLRDDRLGKGRAVPTDLRDLFSETGVGTRLGVPQVVTIEARVKDERGRVLAQLGTVVRMAPRGEGFRTLRWYDTIYGHEGFGDRIGSEDAVEG
ncbi:MAG: general secretion pathway protein GspK [Candidatus Binatia bacterium]